MGNTQRQSSDGEVGVGVGSNSLKYGGFLSGFFAFSFFFFRNVKERPLLVIKEKDRPMLCFYYCLIRKILGVPIDVKEVRGYNGKTKP